MRYLPSLRKRIFILALMFHGAVFVICNDFFFMRKAFMWKEYFINNKANSFKNQVSIYKLTSNTYIPTYSSPPPPPSKKLSLPNSPDKSINFPQNNKDESPSRSNVYIPSQILYDVRKHKSKSQLHTEFNSKNNDILDYNNQQPLHFSDSMAALVTSLLFVILLL
ncbi:hypothetical protein AYI69_g2776 [Smittium culicis]|uniref:Uncharacterized protein n=1 Tax=Smittium culicis TaxID=133412 RepID=A0A1R1YLJ6_9FUNG|nr:hypothetical protein AYI69_g2776 [Smittium culicis]